MCRSIHEIKKAIGAVIFEYSGASDKDIKHQIYLNRETESLCKYQAN